MSTRRAPHRPQPRLATVAIAARAALAALAALSAASSQAQQQPASGGSEVVQVTGLRAALESALNKKREDNGIVDVIRAEDIAKFPDTNLAESLQRIPGVVIDRDAGEGRGITVRGLGPDFTRVRINGIEALTTTGGTDSSGGNNRSRGFDFNVFAAELFNTITVRKSASADVDEGSLGATVDLQASRPFDFPRGLTASGSIKGRYNDLAGKTDPRAAFLVAHSNASRTFGVLFSAAYSKRYLYEEGFSTVRWDNGASSQGWCPPVGVGGNPNGSTATTCGAAAQGVPRVPATAENTAAYNLASSASNFHPRLPRYGRLTHDQDRYGVTASVQLKPNDSALVTLELLAARLKATRQEDFLQAISFSRTAAQGGKPQTTVLSTAYDANGGLLFGTYNGVDVRSESRFDVLSTTFTQPTLTWEQTLSDRLRFVAKGGYADSRFRNPVQTTTTLDALNVNGYGIDFRNDDRLPQITYPFDATQAGGALTLVGVPRVASGTQPTTIPNTTSSEIRIRPQGTNNRVELLQGSLEYDAMPGRLLLKGGVDLKSYSFDTYEFRRVNQNDTIFAPPAGTSVASLSTTISGFGKGLSLPVGAITSWVIPNLNAIAQAYDIYCNCIKSGPAGGPGDYTLSSVTNGNARGNNRAVSEKDTGGWLQGDFSFRLGSMPVRGNAGLRWVKTEQAATGYQATAGGTEVTVSQEYTDVLPSVNLAANVTKDLVVRVAAAKVMARPQLGNLNPGGSISTTGTLSITVGNPLLEPFRAKTLDTSIEWYHGRNAFIGLGVFHKNIDTYIQSLRTNIPYKQTGLPQSLLPSNFTGDEVFQVTTPVNTPGGKLDGFEINIQQPLSFLPGAWRNLGVLLNYTQVRSKIQYLVSPTSTATITDDLLNLSPRSANATLYYDDGTFSARISAARRSSYLQRVPGQNNNDVEGKNSTTNVDFSLSYKVNKQLEVTLEGVNLTNDPNDQFISRARNSPVVYHVTGREYLLGLRYKY